MSLNESALKGEAVKTDSLDDLVSKDMEVKVWEIKGGSRYTHVEGKRLSYLCRRAGIDYRIAIDGYKRVRGSYFPEINGVVILATDLELLKAEIKAREERQTPEYFAELKRRRQERSERVVKAFAAAIRKTFPSAPEGIEDKIAEHACKVGSKRVGRSKTAQNRHENAVTAHIRHNLTGYDKLLDDFNEIGFDRNDARDEARDEVIDDVIEIREEGRTPKTGLEEAKPAAEA